MSLVTSNKLKWLFSEPPPYTATNSLPRKQREGKTDFQVSKMTKYHCVGSAWMMKMGVATPKEIRLQTIAQTLLVGQQEGHRACKKFGVGLLVVTI